jgi:RNA polymerase sigma-70 factor (ECF subfamily)
VELFSFDADYLCRLKQSDASTEQHFFAYFSKMLVIKLRSRLRSSEAVDDIKQETFLRVLRAVRAENAIHSAEKLGSYVNSVCNFVLLEHYRSGKRENPMDEQAPDPPDKTVDLEGALSAKETRAQVRQVLESLDKKDRDLLRAVFLEERDKDEICREFGVDRDYLRVLLYRAKAQFRTRW